MTQDTQTESSSPQSLKVRRAPDFQVLFANYVRMRVAPGEFGFAFGFTDETYEGSLTEERVFVALTPQTAKMLAIALQAALDAYEQQNGPIKKAGNTPADAQHVRQTIDDAVQTFLSSK